MFRDKYVYPYTSSALVVTHCNTLQHTAMCCSVLQCVHCSVLQCVAASCLCFLIHMYICIHLALAVTHCNTLHCVAVCYSVFIAVCCSVLYMFLDTYVHLHTCSALVVTHCNTLQRVTASCLCCWIHMYLNCTFSAHVVTNTLQHAAMCCSVLQLPAAYDIQ